MRWARGVRLGSRDQPQQLADGGGGVAARRQEEAEADPAAAGVQLVRGGGGQGDRGLHDRGARGGPGLGRAVGEGVLGVGEVARRGEHRERPFGVAVLQPVELDGAGLRGAAVVNGPAQRGVPVEGGLRGEVEGGVARVERAEELLGRAPPLGGLRALRRAQTSEFAQCGVPVAGEHRLADQVGALGSAGDAEALGVVVVEEEERVLAQLAEAPGAVGVEVAHGDAEAVALQPADRQRLGAVTVVVQVQPAVGLVGDAPALGAQRGQRHPGGDGDQLLGDPVLVLQAAVGDLAGGQVEPFGDQPDRLHGGVTALAQQQVPPGGVGRLGELDHHGLADDEVLWALFEYGLVRHVRLRSRSGGRRRPAPGGLPGGRGSRVAGGGCR